MTYDMMDFWVHVVHVRCTHPQAGDQSRYFKVFQNVSNISQETSGYLCCLAVP
jgi:hypothetical protein